MVSTETVTPSEARPRTTGTTRRSSSASSTRVAPGRVDSPPTSTRSAPSATRSRPCLTAAVVSNQRPPSEKESGVTLTTPMTAQRSHSGRPATVPASAQRAHTSSLGPSGADRQCRVVRGADRRPGARCASGPGRPAERGRWRLRGRVSVRLAGGQRLARTLAVPRVPPRVCAHGRGGGRAAAQEEAGQGEVDEALGLHRGEADAGQVAGGAEDDEARLPARAGTSR